MRGADGSGELQRLDSSARTNSEEALPQEEVVRRLRLLGQPATLFGEVPPTTVLQFCFSLLHTAPYVSGGDNTELNLLQQMASCNGVQCDY